MSTKSIVLSFKYGNKTKKYKFLSKPTSDELTKIIANDLKTLPEFLIITDNEISNLEQDIRSTKLSIPELENKYPNVEDMDQLYFLFKDRDMEYAPSDINDNLEQQINDKKQALAEEVKVLIDNKTRPSPLKFSGLSIVSETTSLSLPSPFDVYQVFDFFKISAEIVCVATKIQDKVYVKVFDNIPKGQDVELWAKSASDIKEYQNKVYVYFFNKYTKKVEKLKLNLVDGKINVSVTFRSTTERDYIIDLVDRNVRHLNFSMPASSTIQKKKGMFEVFDITVYRDYFLDYVMNTPRVHVNIISNDNGNVNKLHFRYWPKSSPKKIFSFTMKNIPQKNKIECYILNVPSDTNIEDFQKLLASSLSGYKDDFSNIKARYTSYGIPYNPPSKKVKEPKPLDLLKQADIAFYEKTYNKQCDKNRQPIVTQTKDDDKIKAKKMLEWRGNYYECKKPSQYPGFVRKKVGSEFSELPCCFSSEKAAKRSITQTSLKITSKPILGGNKLKKVSLLYPQIGYIPLDLYNLFVSLKKTSLMKTKEDTRKKDMDSFSRVAAMDPDPFLHAMLQAINTNYKNKNNNEFKLQTAEKVRKDILSNKDVFISSKQEQYDMTWDDFTNYKGELTADLFLTSLSTYFKTNIFCFEYVDKFNISPFIPNHSEYYLPNHQLRYTTSVIILKYKTMYFTIAYNAPNKLPCFIVEDMKGYFVDNASTKINNLFLDYFKLFFVSIDTLRLYSTSPTKQLLLAKCSQQYIDVDGKCKGIVIDGVYVRISPIPPLTKKCIGIDDPIRWKAMDLRHVTLISMAYSLNILSKTHYEIVYVDGRDEEYTINIRQTSMDTPNDFVFEIANTLKSVSLWLYIKHSKLDIDDFANRIEVDVNYSWKEADPRLTFDNKSFFRDGYLIVTSDELKKRVIYSTYTYTLHNPQIVSYYQNSELIKKDYSDIRSFYSSPSQNLFIDGDSFLLWYHQKESNSVKREFVDNGITPYFYKTPTNIIGLVQGVVDRSKLKASFVCDAWLTYKKNVGGNPENNDIVFDTVMTLEQINKIVKPTTAVIHVPGKGYYSFLGFSS